MSPCTPTQILHEWSPIVQMLSEWDFTCYQKLKSQNAWIMLSSISICSLDHKKHKFVRCIVCEIYLEIGRKSKNFLKPLYLVKLSKCSRFIPKKSLNCSFGYHYIQEEFIMSAMQASTTFLMSIVSHNTNVHKYTFELWPRRSCRPGSKISIRSPGANL